jgi:molybdopterin/thiamine biosynthesis adenylyltransferase
VSDLRVLLVGVGGIGAPAAIALARAGVSELAFADDDTVDLTNLHRQILFSDADVGSHKIDAFSKAIRARAPGLTLRPIRERATPDSALRLVEGAGVVIDASDNFATRFLLADACGIAKVPVVHAAAIRWRATVIAAGPSGRPCYRCLFENLPDGPAPDCATAGVVGPVCGVAGAIAADTALRILRGDGSVLGRVVTYDGIRDILRAAPVRARAGCALCGERPAIRTLDRTRYETPQCETRPSGLASEP